MSLTTIRIAQIYIQFQNWRTLVGLV